MITKILTPFEKMKSLIESCEYDNIKGDLMKIASDKRQTVIHSKLLMMLSVYKLYEYTESDFLEIINDYKSNKLKSTDKCEYETSSCGKWVLLTWYGNQGNKNTIHITHGLYNQFGDTSIVFDRVVSLKNKGLMPIRGSAKRPISKNIFSQGLENEKRGKKFWTWTQFSIGGWNYSGVGFNDQYGGSVIPHHSCVAVDANDFSRQVTDEEKEMYQVSISHLG